jgi:PTS system nitrogen regulatory IIA component
MGIIGRIKHMISALRSYSQEPEAPVVLNPISVSDVLTEKNILFFPSAFTKQLIFETLIGTMNLDNPELALKEVLYRELWGRTVIAPGLALPHARIVGMTRISAALGICSKGIADSPTTENTRPQLILLFVGPTSDVQQHLAFLAAVSSLFQTKDLPQHLVQLTRPSSVLNQLRAAEGKR